MAMSEPGRREFLFRVLGGAGSAWLAANWPEILTAHEHAQQSARSNPPFKFEFFTPEQAAEVEAVAEQIIPTDSTPGAREARVVYFIDRALATFDREKQELYRKGLQELRQKSAARLPGVAAFSRLDSARQIEILKGIEKTKFFETVRTHTIAGFFANPEYGGNTGRIGWRLIGFEDEFSFEPPFGYYDREENRQS